MNAYVLGYHQILPTKFELARVSELEDLSFYSGQLELDRTNKYFPNRSDEKIMRQDVIASVIAVNTLLEKCKIGKEREDFSLFVASGVFIEKIEQHVRHITKVYEELTELSTPKETMQKLYRGSPPLLALQTLTNSAMSFISQYAGIKGNNATFGTNSIAGFHAIEEGVNDVMFRGRYAVVSASNVAATHSYLMNSTLTDTQKNWKESAAAACILLRNNSINQKSLCKISKLKTVSNLAQLENKKIEQSWQSLIPESKPDAIIFSGAYTNSVFEEDKKYCETLCKETFSRFNEYGNLGPTNTLISLIDGIELIQKGYSKIDILDRDIYGNETLIRIEKPE